MNPKYLIDTDILIDFFKAKFALDQKFKSIGLGNCAVSEISMAELTYGALKSSNVSTQLRNVSLVKSSFHVIPISNCLDVYSAERLRLEKLGNRLPDFDLLIASSAVVNNLILVTGNEKHHSRINALTIENWRQKIFNTYIQ